MTAIVNFCVIKFSCKKEKGRKSMLKFDEYVTELEERRAKEKNAAINAELARRLCEGTKEDAVAELYAALTFLCGSSTVLVANNRAFA